MQTKHNFNGRLSIPSISPGTAALPFEMQPIMRLADEVVHGYELLYRGARPVSWSDVDRSVLAYFASRAQSNPVLYVNLSNETILTTPDEVFHEAAQKNKLVFELSESFVDVGKFDALAAKVNTLSAAGVRFAIDDFGSGLDGMKRLYAFNRIEAVKIDGGLLATTMSRPDAESALKALVANWRSSAIVTVAECVENDEMLSFARGLGVDMVQGWHIDALLAPSALLTA